MTAGFAADSIWGGLHREGYSLSASSYALHNHCSTERAHVIEATLTAGGFNHQDPCVYVINITSPQGDWMYVGRTQTSNGAGTSSPYKRLALHLAKRGATQSCIWDNHPDPLSSHILAEARIAFRAIYVPAQNVAVAERWLWWYIGQHPGYLLLNRELAPLEEPGLNDLDLQHSLMTLVPAIG